jgi:hypothetical protein
MLSRFVLKQHDTQRWLKILIVFSKKFVAAGDFLSYKLIQLPSMDSDVVRATRSSSSITIPQTHPHTSGKGKRRRVQSPRLSPHWKTMPRHSWRSLPSTCHINGLHRFGRCRQTQRKRMQGERPLWIVLRTQARSMDTRNCWWWIGECDGGCFDALMAISCKNEPMTWWSQGQDGACCFSWLYATIISR